MDIYKITRPTVQPIPILLSIPHCGTAFPDELSNEYNAEMLPPDDTDCSRWVIDLNRNPDSTPLYTDGRVITSLCTTSNFLGEPIYKDKRETIDLQEVERRKTLYFDPYQQKMQELLDELKARFGNVLLWDCHSIRRRVPSIQSAAFPDLILGSADETSAATPLIDAAIGTLSSTYQINHNTPFKGGYITRHFGQPNRNQHALQLEMCKDLYMDNAEMEYNEIRAQRMQHALKKCLQTMHYILTKI
jgi:N-formylglutamate deformylase